MPATVRPVVNRLRQALATIRDVGDTAELDQALAEELNQNTVRWIAQTCIQSLHLDVRGPPGRVSPEELRAHRELVEEDGGDEPVTGPDVRPDPPRGPSAEAKAAAAAMYDQPKAKAPTSEPQRAPDAQTPAAAPEPTSAPPASPAPTDTQP